MRYIKRWWYIFQTINIHSKNVLPCSNCIDTWSWQCMYTANTIAINATRSRSLPGRTKSRKEAKYKKAVTTKPKLASNSTTTSRRSQIPREDVVAIRYRPLKANMGERSILTLWTTEEDLLRTAERKLRPITANTRAGEISPVKNQYWSCTIK